jgi:hypothetical protein
MNMAHFSEFSYGYAMTDNILHSGLPHSSHAPVFPSQFAEGRPGGGYDVMIPLRPVPVFLQFKIPQVVRRRSNQTPPSYDVPYLRMHLRTWRPNQHQLMLDLEGTGKLVYYATPDFWTKRKLDEHFTNGRVHERSWYIPPGRIGALDDQPHYVAYRLGSNVGWRHSELEKLEGRFDAENFAREINAAVQKARPQEPLSFLSRIKHDIAEITRTEIMELQPQLAELEIYTEKREPIKGKTADSNAKAEMKQRRLIRQAMREVSYLSQVRLGCSFLITGTN